MKASSATTEAVVRNHLQTFLDRKGVAALLEDYDQDARLYSEAEIYDGRNEIGRFFAGFLGGLPDGTIERFALRSLRVNGSLAHITWSAGEAIPFGTDTFVVESGKIVSQTVAMYAPGSGT